MGTMQIGVLSFVFRKDSDARFRSGSADPTSFRCGQESGELSAATAWPKSGTAPRCHPKLTPHRHPSDVAP